MSSKKKKSGKPSKLSNSAQSSNLSSPSVDSTSVSSAFNSSDEQLLSSLDEASEKFPSLICRTAVIGTVVGEAANDQNCRIWLSESAMGSSISPCSCVSVSLYSMDKSLSGLPLSALSDECARNFGFDLADNLDDEAGNFFVLATVLPCRQLSKNEVRLSLNLSNSLGCPAPGRIIFICPVKSSENENDKGCISFNSCKELYLSPVYLKGKVEMEGIFDMKEVFADDSLRKNLENCMLMWLNKQNFLSANFVRVSILGRHCIFQVVGPERLLPNKETVPAFAVNVRTRIHFMSPSNPMVETSLSNSLTYQEVGPQHIGSSTIVNFPKLGGLSNELEDLKHIIVSSTAQDVVASLGLKPTRGVLLHGPKGTGKTTLAKVCAHEAGVNMFLVNGPEIISQYHGQTEEALHDVFDKASNASPAVVFIDELDSIAPARKEGGDGLSESIVTTLLDLMDGMGGINGVLVIASTRHLDSIEPALRRPGRFDKEINIGVPSPGQRREILSVLLSEMNHSLSAKDIENLAMKTHGYVGADLDGLCKEAGRVRFRYVKSETQNSFDITDGIALNRTCDTLRIPLEDFDKARVTVRPSAMREVLIEIPKVRWEDVGGQVEIKRQLSEVVQWPLMHKDAFKRIGCRPPNGILLYGPPGCSKTLLARAVASEAGLNFLAVKGPELFSKWVGESEKAVRSIFAKARENAPSIIFFDEFDGLAAIRGQESDGVSVGDRVISQLLVELNGLQDRGDVTVIGATNRPDNIDPALLRPGRFDRLIYVGLPNREDREEIFGVHLRHIPCSSDVCLSELARLTEGFTGADISLICRAAGMRAIEENFNATEMRMEHLKCGVEQIEPSDVGMYEELIAKFQRHVPATKPNREGI